MGIAFLLMAAFLWGMIGPVSKAVFNLGISPLESAFWRGVLAGLAFFIHWLIKRYPLPKSSKDWLNILLFGIFGVALLEGSFVLAVDFGGAALASILLYSAPIWVNLCNLLVFKEPIPRKRWLALAVTSCGVIGICLWGATVSFSQKALIWGLLSGVSYAGFYVTGKIFFKRINPVVVYMIAFPVASVAILPFISILAEKSMWSILNSPMTYTYEALCFIVFIGWISTYLPYLLYGAGLRLVDAGRAAIITMIEPVVAVALASLVWGERLSVAGYLFAALVLLGVYLS